MPVESADDRAVFSNPDEFGVEFTYVVSGGDTTTLNGVFDEPTEDRFDGPGAQVSVPQLSGVRALDIPEDAEPGENTGDVITIGERTFAPRTIEPDGTGMSRIMLEEID